MSFYYGSEKSRDYIGIDSIDGFESKLKEMTDRLRSLSEYEQQCDFIRHELECCNSHHIIPQNVRLGVYYVALSKFFEEIKGFSQKRLLNDLELAHNSFTKWNLYPERDSILFRRPLPNIPMHRNGVKRGDMLSLLRLLLISQNADTFCDLFGGLGSVTKAVEWYFKQKNWNDPDKSVYSLLCAVRDSGDVGAILEEMRHSNGWRTHSCSVDSLPKLDSVMLNYDFTDCYNSISEQHKNDNIIWYFDPPYFCTAQYDLTFSDTQHVQLIKMIKRLSTNNQKFVLSIKNRVTNKRLYCENPRRSSYRYGTDGSGAVIKNFNDYLKGILPEYEFRRSGKVFELVKVPKSCQPKHYELYVYRLFNSKYADDSIITNFYCPTGIMVLINGAIGKKVLPEYEVLPYRQYLEQLIQDSGTV